MYAKIKDGVVVCFPYGFDDLQREFNEILKGEITIPDTFRNSQAYQSGYSLVVVRLESKPLAHSPGELHVLNNTPTFVENEWVQQWVVQTVPYPTDGKQYVWNPRTRSWDEV